MQPDPNYRPPSPVPSPYPPPPYPGYPAPPYPSPQAPYPYYPYPYAPPYPSAYAQAPYPRPVGWAAQPYPPGPAPQVAAPLAPVARPLRTWPALLTLFFLAPAIGEMLSGSTPPLMFINPLSLFFEAGLYGSGAILVRELVRRRGLGWLNVLLLGAAYGVLEEGLVVTSWFNPYWPDLNILATYGRLLDTSWVWAVGLTTYHAVVSITIPIVLAEALVSRIADRPWLGRKGFPALAIWLTVISLLELLGFGFLAYRKQGYIHPPAMYLVALALAVGLVWLGLRFRPRPLPANPLRRAPRLWTLRLAALAATVAFFFALWFLPHLVPLALVPALAIAGLVALGVWRVRAWAARRGWGARQRLALAAGAMGFFLLLAPLVEFSVRPPGKNLTGMTAVALLWLAGLIWLARRAKRQDAAARDVPPVVGARPGIEFQG
jgi:hypothetical protein